MFEPPWTVPALHHSVPAVRNEDPRIFELRHYWRQCRHPGIACRSPSSQAGALAAGKGIGMWRSASVYLISSCYKHAIPTVRRLAASANHPPSLWQATCHALRSRSCRNHMKSKQRTCLGALSTPGQNALHLDEVPLGTLRHLLRTSHEAACTTCIPKLPAVEASRAAWCSQYRLNLTSVHLHPAKQARLLCPARCAPNVRKSKKARLKKHAIPTVRRLVAWANHPPLPWQATGFSF